MIGVLFHGPEVFDSGWAAKIMRAFPRARCMLAGTMSRTALFDSGLKGVETPGAMPSACIKALARDCSAVLLATSGKAERAGLIFGRLVAERSGAGAAVVQAECSGPVWAAHCGSCPPRLRAALQKMGFSPRPSPAAAIEVWREGGRVLRRMTTAAKGDFVLVGGIVVGRALGGEVVFSAAGRSIKEIRGVRVKAHGLEKIERLGGVDLAKAKLASTRALRRGKVPARLTKGSGSGVVFIDHAGMHVYDLARGAAGAVTVGDDTTAVAGDILRRFGVPIVGIVDGDGDKLHSGGSFASGSSVLVVKADDKSGLKVLEKIFRKKTRSHLPFALIKKGIVELLNGQILASLDY